MTIGRYGLVFTLFAAGPLIYSTKLAWWSTHPDGPKVGIRVRSSPLPPSRTCSAGLMHLCVTLDAKKELRVNGWLATLQELRKQVASRPYATVYVWADPSLPYAEAVAVLDVVQSVGGRIVLVPGKRLGEF